MPWAGPEGAGATPDITVWITTYNRPAELRALLADLITDSGSLRVRCRVYNDGSTVPYPDLPASTATFTLEYVDLPGPHGKPGYWQLIDRIFQDLRSVPSRFYMQLQDDVRVRPGFFAHALQTYQAIPDPHKIALNLYLDSSRIGQPCWTPRLPRLCRFAATRVFQTGWIDGFYLGERALLAALDYHIHPIAPRRWHTQPQRSSGVGMQMSQRLQAYTLYQVRECFLREVATPSLLNPDRPAQEDLRVTHLDPIICGIASLPERAGPLQQTVQSILDFVDELHVFLNGYPAIPAYLAHPKITVYRSQDYGDWGDAGKFFTVGATPGFYLAIDDDIIYPETYSWQLVNAIRQHRQAQRRVAVGLHGKIMRPQVAHYYRGHARKFHFAAAVDAVHAVHVLGTGTVAFHTADVPVRFADFAGPRNMADIHFSIACQRHNVRCLVLPRPANYLISQPIPEAQTIAGSYRDADQAPTALYNSWPDWRLRGEALADEQ